MLDKKVKQYLSKIGKVGGSKMSRKKYESCLKNLKIKKRQEEKNGN